MPVPSELEGKKLVGSIWTRRMGKHRGYKWVIERFTEAGVRLIPDKNSYRGMKTHIDSKAVTSLQWPMFMNLYEPEGNLEMIVMTDKEGMVLKVEREQVPVNGVVKEADVPAKVTPVEVVLRKCNGPWHNKGGKGTMLPVDQFEISTRGPYAGTLGSTCISCKNRSKEYGATHTVRKPGKLQITPSAVTPKVTMQEAIKVYHDTPAAPKKIMNTNESVVHQLPEGPEYEWEITVQVIKIVEETRKVKAKDLLDLAALTEGEKVVNVRRI